MPEKLIDPNGQPRKRMLQVSLDEDLVLRIKGLAGVSGRRPHQIVAEALRDYFIENPFRLPGE